METNSLKFTDYRIDKNGNQWEIKISLDDDCKNGHQDFAITGTCWDKGKQKKDNSVICAGACGDKIARLFPEYAIFYRLHLCDYKGIPMHCSANGYYFLKNGFSSKSTGEAFISEFCEYFNISKDDFFKIYKAESQTHFAILLEQTGIFEKWEQEAKKAIKILENLTGNEFVIDSKKTQYHRPEQAEMIAELERLDNGYYSEQAKREREEEQEKKQFNEIEEDEKKAIEKIKLEYKIKKLIFKTDKKAFKNYIFYNFCNEICFNWKEFETQLTTEEVENITNKIKNELPEGFKFTNKMKGK